MAASTTDEAFVVFDRVRENFRKLRKKTTIETVNYSVNQTISRTLMTSFTTLLVLLSLFFLGGEIIHAFALALIIGVVVGTYSSIYVATTTALALAPTPAASIASNAAARTFGFIAKPR